MLKGSGKNKGKGKGVYGKGSKGGWNYGKRYGNYINYRSPGKGVGKGLHGFYDGYWNAWGDEQWNHGDNSWEWEHGWHNGGDMGDLSMPLESGMTKKEKDKAKTNGKSGEQTMVSIGEADALTNTRRKKAIPISNSSNT